MFRLEPRVEPSQLMRYGSPLVAVALTVVTGFVLFSVLGRDPVAAFHAFFIAPVSTANGVSELLLKSSPLALCAIGLAIGFRANVWNIGAEGQLILGAIAGSALALHVPDLPAWMLLPAMVLAGAVGGMAWAAIPAWLRTRFNTNEILTSLMLAYVAGLLLSWLVHDPWRDPEGYNFPQSKMFEDNALFPLFFEGMRLNASALIAVAAVLAAWLFVSKTFLGYQMRVAGLSDAAARYAGFSAPRTVWIGMLAGGAAAGIAGVGEVAGPLGQLVPSVSPGYGFAAIIVAFIGRLHPVGVLFASVLMSLLYLGGESAQMNLGLPAAITGLFQGVLLFYLLGSDVFIHYRLRWRKPSVRRSAAALAAASSR
jgi:ABC-type uncharacterized transport system permease subunit